MGMVGRPSALIPGETLGEGIVLELLLLLGVVVVGLVRRGLSEGMEIGADIDARINIVGFGILFGILIEASRGISTRSVAVR
jgi:hypothetical protein